MTKAVCKDCRRDGVLKPRPAPFPGPRCATHHRLFKRKQAKRRREQRVSKKYNVPPALQQALLDACPRNDRGEPLCPICWRYRPRSLDHDHRCCSGPTSCGKCARGIICQNCNQVLGRMRDDAEAFLRAAAYLTQPPAQRLGLGTPDNTVVHPTLPTVDFEETAAVKVCTCDLQEFLESRGHSSSCPAKKKVT